MIKTTQRNTDMAGLEDLYREIILDHYRNPRNKGELDAPASKTDGVNPSCGDEISVYLLLEGTGDTATVTDIKIGGVGCSISQSSASMMSSSVKGKTVGEARALIRTFKSMMNIRDAAHDSGHESAHESAEDGHEHPAEAAPVKLGDLEALQGVVKFPTRIKCATLAWTTMDIGFNEAAK
jgi:nitrogen fixation protein NifU and related proteins